MRSFASGELRAKIISRWALEQPIEVGVAHRLELVTGDRHFGVDADPAGDLGRGETVVAGDDDDADAGGVTVRDGVGDLGSGRVEHGDQSEEAQIRLGVLAPVGEALPPGAPGERRRALAGPGAA